MEKTMSTSSYDVIVIQHRNGTFKSTPFQVVFSSSAIKNKDPKKCKSKDITLIINEQTINLPLRLDQNGRLQFQKKYIRKVGAFSDSSDVSDDEKLSTRSPAKDPISSGSVKNESIEQLKNEQAPKNFWQFAWLFNSKNPPVVPSARIPDQNLDQQPKLARIKQQPYQGEQSSKQPLFQLSLCGHLLTKMRKQASKQQLQKMFYANKIQFKQFVKDPLGIINDANLVVRIDNSLYTWQLGAAILASKFAFGVQPGQHFADELIKAKNKKSWFTIFGSNNVTKLDIEKDPPAAVQPPSKPEDAEIFKYRKVPDSQMVSKMGLKFGENKAKVILEVNPGQFEQTEFRIFLWNQNEQVVISDIDGTITISDVIGQIKNNYIHKGVCLLYNEIYKRNYKMLYMTARAIGQYNQTRRFLQKEVEQNGMRLPPGPILMSPQGYYISFRREVIEKTPDQLKIKLLASINQIFPNSKKPIIAGFGNRETDTIAYLRIKIPLDRIFCINQKSVITNEHNKNLATTYIEMLQKIQEYFPYNQIPLISESSLVDRSNKEGTKQETKQGMTDQQENAILNKRKLSHSEFYERSGSKRQKQENNSKNGSRAKSQEGDTPSSNQEFQMFLKQFLSHEPDKKKSE